ncbi:MAG: hypothetical protein IJT96_03285 [Lachnospiraceae bacterium]|nr:hypothetical protein [Lachnospiraceae bacterium]
MLNKKLIAMGLTTLMVASTPLTALAAGPGGPGGDHGGSGGGSESHHSEEAHHDDGGHDAPAPQGASSDHSQPGGNAPSGNQDSGQQAPPSMPSGQDNVGQDNGSQLPPSMPSGQGNAGQDNSGQQPPSMPSQSGDMGQGGRQMPGQPGQNDQMMPPQQGMGGMQPGQQQDAEWYRQVQQVINQILEEMGQPTITLDDLTAMMGIPNQAPEGKNDMGQSAGNQQSKPGNKAPSDNNAASKQGDKPDGNGSSMQDGKPVNGGPDMQNGNQGERPEMQDNGQGGPGGKPGEMGGSSAPTEYTAANTVTEDVSDQSYSSEANSENAVLVDGKTVSITGTTVTKSGNASDEDADFYGINAGILANNGADLTLSDVTVNTDGAHANGVFSYGSGTSVTITDSAITTTGSNSGGLMTTGGASLTASNVTIDTSGNSSAAIRTDRGGGTVTADNIDATTSGVGSPAIYSTADITVSDSTLNADRSEAVVIEGGNSVTITDSSLTGNNSKLNGQSTIATNVLIYQSMSGDASEGNSDFTMTGGSLTSKTGCMFHVTNVTTTISLTDVDLSYASDSDAFMVLSADSWGTSGKNGGNATVNLSNQEASGDITVDSVSSLVLNLTDSSSYTGAINSDKASSSVKVTLEAGSTWTLTGDSYVTSLSGDTSGIDTNGYTLYVNGKAYNA